MRRLLAAAATVALFGGCQSGATAPKAQAQKKSLAELFDQMFEASLSVTHAEQLHDVVHAMGPMYVKCVQLTAKSDGQAMEETVVFEKAYGDWPLEGANAAVGLRSISKILASVAVLALADQGKLTLDMQVADVLGYPCGLAGQATIHDLLSMNSRAMDNRINALRRQQIAARGQESDFLGFPPICDNLRWDVARCARDFVCPLLRGDANAWVVAEFDPEKPPIDVTCGVNEQERLRCLRYTEENPEACAAEKAAMAHHCPFVCAGDVKCADNGAYAKRGDEVYHWDYSTTLGRLTKQLRRGMVYDNNGYLLVDAMVIKLTGHDLVYWVKELVFKPLDMQSALGCLGQSCPAGITCYAPVTSVQATMEPWPVHMGGLHSPSWVSNTFFASANDLVTFLSMLLRNGTTATGRRIVSHEGIDRLFSRHLECTGSMHHCLGVHFFSYGIGGCDGADPGVWPGAPTYGLFTPPPSYFVSDKYAPSASMCQAPEVWGWASSYGSRFSLLRDYNVACAVMGNQYTGVTKHGVPFSARSHYLAHNMSAVLRYIYPLKS